MTSTVHMANSPTIGTSDGQLVTAALNQAVKQLDGPDKEIVLDFSFVHRIQSRDVQRLEEFAHAAEVKNVRVSLRGVNVEVYKALKLTKLTRQFLFVN
jgi:anti-anti-sigma regulatory factor